VRPELLCLMRLKKAEGKGFEPDGDFDVTADGDCPCDFCQGWRAALALQNDGSESRNLSSLDADLQPVVATWEGLPTHIRKTILALAGFVEPPANGKTRG